MMKIGTPILYLIVFICIAGRTEAQQFSKGNTDSVKAFLQFWLATNHNVKDRRILDSPSFKQSDALLINSIKSLETHAPIKVYKKNMGRTEDSISLTIREGKEILRSIIMPKKWTQDYFPSNAIIKQNGVDSFYEFALAGRDRIGYFYKLHNYNTTEIKNDPEYKKYIDSLQAVSEKYTNGYEIISRPIFIRKGAFVVFFAGEMTCEPNGMLYGTSRLYVFIRRGLAWEYFGSEFGIDLN